jgi:hypothetical protein
MDDKVPSPQKNRTRTAERGERARRLVGISREFSPDRHAVAELVAERAGELPEEEEERFWSEEGEERLRSFDRRGSVRHEDAWS